MTKVKELIDHSKNIGKWYVFSDIKDWLNATEGTLAILKSYSTNEDYKYRFCGGHIQWQYGRPLTPAEFGWECK